MDFICKTTASLLYSKPAALARTKVIDNLTNETFGKLPSVFCSFLKRLLSDESHDAVAATAKEAEEEHTPYGRGLRSDNVE